MMVGKSYCRLTALDGAPPRFTVTVTKPPGPAGRVHTTLVSFAVTTTHADDPEKLVIVTVGDDPKRTPWFAASA